MKHCCKDKGVCSIHDYQKLDDLVYLIKEKLSFLSDQRVKNIKYNYYCGENIVEDIERLITFKNSLDRIKKSIYSTGRYCLSDEKVQLIIEKVIKEVGRQKCGENKVDIIKDDSLVKKYILDGNLCISYDLYNEYAYRICRQLGVKITAEKEVCDLTFSLSREIISCDLLYSLSVVKELCDLKYVVERSKDDECKIDYKLLIEEYPDIDLTYKTYNSLIKDHNISSRVIKNVYDCKLSLDINNVGVVVLNTPVSQFNLLDITPSNTDELSSLGFNITTTKKEIKNEYVRY